jgi:hypothetical protein
MLKEPKLSYLTPENPRKPKAHLMVANCRSWTQPGLLVAKNEIAFCLHKNPTPRRVTTGFPIDDTVLVAPRGMVIPTNIEYLFHSSKFDRRFV